jgi:biopolymer transport protein TolR
MAMQVRAQGAVSNINVTPLVDVMLVLLIIFMVITPMLQKTFSVDMAAVENPMMMHDAEKDTAVTIAVTRDGKLYLGNTPVQVAELPDKIKDMLSTELDKTVYIKADKRAKYGVVVQAVNTVRDAKVEQIGLLTEKLETRPGAPGAASAP